MIERATISEEDLESVDLNIDDESVKRLPALTMTEEEYTTAMNDLSKPVEIQKHIATKISLFLNHYIDKELREKGKLSEFTRRWVNDYNKHLDMIHKNLYGDKSFNLHLHKVTHAHIANEMRKYAPNKQDNE